MSLGQQTSSYFESASHLLEDVENAIRKTPTFNGLILCKIDVEKL